VLASSQDRVQKTFRTAATMVDAAQHVWVFAASGCKAGRLGGVNGQTHAPAMGSKARPGRAKQR